MTTVHAVTNVRNMKTSRMDVLSVAVKSFTEV